MPTWAVITPLYHTILWFTLGYRWKCDLPHVLLDTSFPPSLPPSQWEAKCVCHHSPNSQSMTTDKTSQNWGITGDTGLTLSLREREPVIVTEYREDIDKTNTATLIIVRCGTIQPVRSQHHIQSVTTSVADPSLGYGGTGTTNGVFRGQTSANLTQGGNQHHSTTMVGLHWCSKYNLLGDTT